MTSPNFFIIFDTHTPIVRLFSNRPLLLSSQNPSPKDRDVNYGRPRIKSEKRKKCDVFFEWPLLDLCVGPFLHAFVSFYILAKYFEFVMILKNNFLLKNSLFPQSFSFIVIE